ncbi:MAG: hypothetical protein ACK5NF_02000, partial [Bacilli bacterium]
MKNHISNLKYKQSVINYSSRFGVSCSFIYKWINRYDGSIDSLKELSRRPHLSPNESSNKEYTLIYNHVKLNPNLSLVDLLVKLKRKGIITSTPKEYETMSYPSERVQVDVKHLPSISLTSS